MEEFESLGIKIILYTRVELALEALKKDRCKLDSAIRSHDAEAIDVWKERVSDALDKYLDCLQDYNNYLSGRLSKDAAQKHFVYEADATYYYMRTIIHFL